MLAQLTTNPADLSRQSSLASDASGLVVANPVPCWQSATNATVGYHGSLTTPFQSQGICRLTSCSRDFHCPYLLTFNTIETYKSSPWHEHGYANLQNWLEMPSSVCVWF